MDRVEWGGDNEERDYRNYYKGHRDQIKEKGGGGRGRVFGRGGLDGWGEMAHKCN